MQDRKKSIPPGELSQWKQMPGERQRFSPDKWMSGHTELCSWGGSHSREVKECPRAPSKTKGGTEILLEIYQDETIHYRFSRGGPSILAEVTIKSPDLNLKCMSSREKRWNEEARPVEGWERQDGGERTGASRKHQALSSIFPAACTSAACSPAWKAFETLLPLQRKTLMQHPHPTLQCESTDWAFKFLWMGSISSGGSSLCSGYQNALWSERV